MMNFKTRFLFTFKFLFLVIFNFFNSIAIVILYTACIPFCLWKNEILIKAMNNVKGLFDHSGNPDVEGLQLMKELLFDYRTTLNVWTEGKIDILKNPENRWAVNEAIKYLEKNNVKVGE